MPLEKIIQRLKMVYEKHRGNDKISAKIYEFVDVELPERIKSHLKRETRRERLEQRSEAYINEFLSGYAASYSYIPVSNIFITYDGHRNSPIGENVILHKVLTGISTHRDIIPWKYKIKNLIMKRIRDQGFFRPIPESATIQTVLCKLTPALFRTKAEAKYFLAVLGDNILRKNSKLIHLVDPQSKDFLLAIQENTYHYFRNSHHTNTTFKYKYHEHDYFQCRIITFNTEVANSTYWAGFIKSYILDILSTAVHYSKRYQSADNYLVHSLLDIDVYNNICYIKSRTEKEIVEEFLNEFVEELPTSSDLIIHWREMYYLWKSFLKQYHLPSMIFTKQLKCIVGARLDYDVDRDVYTHATSSVLSYVSNLQKFWRDNIHTDENDEFKISELCHLYDEWLGTEGLKKDRTMNESIMLFILQHFYEITVRNGKSITGITCTLWNKQEDLRTVFAELKIKYKFSPELYDRTLASIYPDYCAYRTKLLPKSRTVSKQYFTKYIAQVVPKQYVLGNRIANGFWVT